MGEYWRHAPQLKRGPCADPLNPPTSTLAYTQIKSAGRMVDCVEVNRKRLALLFGVVVVTLLLGKIGIGSFETVRDNRQQARERAAWPVQRAKLEQALRAVSAPAGWVVATCPASGPTSLNRCWSGQRDLPTSYASEAVAALKSAVVLDVGWECERSPMSPKMPGPACAATAVIGGRGIAVTVFPRLDAAASRTRHEPTFHGVDISLGADLSPPY